MTKHQRKLLLSACVALGAMLVAAFSIPWFKMHVDITGHGLGDAEAALDSARLSIGLHTATACLASGQCASTDLDNLTGSFPSLANYTFWITIVLSGLVAIQAVLRLLTGAANSFLSSGGYVVAILAMGGAGLTAFVFAPETAETTMATVIVDRTWAPALMFAGYMVALYALYLATADDGYVYSEEVAPPVSLTRTPQRDAIPSQPIVPITRSRVPDTITLEPEPLPRPTPTPVPDEPRDEPPPVRPACPEPLRGKLSYATLVATFTTAGIDAEREDGSKRRIAWGDVVGVVARRFPAEEPYAGLTFVDLVSLAGSTLRILPWTSVGGELSLPEQADAAERARAFVQLIAARCPEARLDSATRGFLGGRGHAAQLATADLLSQHDARLA